MSEQVRSLYAETAEEHLRRWDAGESVFTVEMGGLGPGYEQAIQVLAIEIMRDYIRKPLPISKEDQAEFGAATLKKHDDSLGGMSGAQFGAARHLAFKFLSDGPRAALEKAREQGIEGRIIQASRDWPKAVGAPRP